MTKFLFGFNLYYAKIQAINESKNLSGSSALLCFKNYMID